MGIATEPSHIHDEYVRALASGLIQSLVSDDEEFTVAITAQSGYCTVQVRGSEEVIAILVGVKGQMARALRTLLAGTSAKLGRRYALDLEPVVNA